MAETNKTKKSPRPKKRPNHKNSSNNNQGGKTVIIVTHDMEVAARCGRVIEISDGEIV